MAEEAVRESEARFRSVFESSTDAIVLSPERYRGPHERGMERARTLGEHSVLGEDA